MKKIANPITVYLAGVILLFSLWWVLSCNNSPAKDTPMSFAKTIQSTTKPVRDSIKIVDPETGVVKVVTVKDTYKVNVTVSYDSVVFITSYVPGVPVPPTDTVVVPPPSTGYEGYTLVYSNDFSKPSDLNSNQLGSGSIKNGAFNSVVKAGAGKISGGYRSEQQYSETLSPNDVPIIVEYDIMFESIPGVDGLAVQWHGNVTGTSGQMSMWTTEKSLHVQQNLTGKSLGSNIHQPKPWTPIVVGKWYHVKWDIKFSATNGWVKNYIDNDLKYSVTGKTADGSGQYLKVGQNLFASPKKDESLYIKNLRVYKAK